MSRETLVEPSESSCAEDRLHNTKHAHTINSAFGQWAAPEGRISSRCSKRAPKNGRITVGVNPTEKVP